MCRLSRGKALRQNEGRPAGTTTACPGCQRNDSVTPPWRCSSWVGCARRTRML